MSKPTYRPRLEASTDGVGFNPYAAPNYTPPPEPAPKPPLAALYDRLDAFRRQCYLEARAAREEGFAAVSRADVDWLNLEFAGIRQLNAVLGNHVRIAAVVAWPDPVLPP